MCWCVSAQRRMPKKESAKEKAANKASAAAEAAGVLARAAAPRALRLLHVRALGA